jgi:hypothetical protein
VSGNNSSDSGCDGSMESMVALSGTSVSDEVHKAVKNLVNEVEND